MLAGAMAGHTAWWVGAKGDVTHNAQGDDARRLANDDDDDGGGARRRRLALARRSIDATKKLMRNRFV